jgi:hypothetical protein
LNTFFEAKIYPEESAFEDAFSVCFSVGKKFEHLHLNTGSLEADRLNEPVVIIYTAVDNDKLQDIDPDLDIRKAFYLYNFELLHRESDVLEELKASAREVIEVKNDMESAVLSQNTKLCPVKEYFEQASDSSEPKMVDLYSSIWRLEDFMIEGCLDPVQTNRIDKSIGSFLSIISNATNKIIDFGFERNISKITVQSTRDRNRRKNIFFNQAQNVLNAQQTQIIELAERSALIEKETTKVVETSEKHSSQLEDLEREIAEMDALLGTEIKSTDLSDVEESLSLTEEESEIIKDIKGRSALEVRKAEDWEALVKSSESTIDKEEPEE